MATGSAAFSCRAVDVDLCAACHAVAAAGGEMYSSEEEHSDSSNEEEEEEILKMVWGPRPTALRGRGGGGVLIPAARRCGQVLVFNHELYRDGQVRPTAGT
jgi:hypothetical protein